MSSHDHLNHQTPIPSEICWLNCKKRAGKREPRNLAELEMITKDEWKKNKQGNQSEICERLFWTPPKSFREQNQLT